MNRVFAENNLVDLIRYKKYSDSSYIVDNLSVQCQINGDSITFNINGVLTSTTPSSYLVCEVLLPSVIFRSIQQHSINAIKDDIELVSMQNILGIDEDDEIKESISSISMYEPHKSLYIHIHMPEDCADNKFYFNYNFTILLSNNITQID